MSYIKITLCVKIKKTSTLYTKGKCSFVINLIPKNRLTLFFFFFKAIYPTHKTLNNIN